MLTSELIDSVGTCVRVADKHAFNGACVGMLDAVLYDNDEPLGCVVFGIGDECCYRSDQLSAASEGDHCHCKYCE